MKIGTLSFERQGNEMALASKERAHIIYDTFRRHMPDLLLCAGWSVDTIDDLNTLEQKLVPYFLSNGVVVEVRHGDGSGAERNGNFSFLLTRDGHLPLGQQVFKTRADLSDKKLVAEYERTFDTKVASIRGKRMVNLCCGEINILSGRETVKPLAMGDALLKADIVLNPTHDRMGNGGTLGAKRKWLSQKVGQRNRVYVSASNWNTKKEIGGNLQVTRVQKPNSRTLHTVYVSGQECHMSQPACAESGYVYREVEVAI